MRRTLI
jgi:hypothetical protein